LPDPVADAVTADRRTLSDKEPPAFLQIEVIVATPERQQRLSLSVPADCTARQAVQLACTAGLDTVAAGLNANDCAIGIFGQQVDDGRTLATGDRLELYRPLLQDPKEWRRRRAERDRKDA